MTATDNVVTLDGDKLRRIRKSRPGKSGRWMTQDDLAELTRISRSYVAELERGTRRPRIFVAEAIASALHIELEEILD